MHTNALCLNERACAQTRVHAYVHGTCMRTCARKDCVRAMDVVQTLNMHINKLTRMKTVCVHEKKMFHVRIMHVHMLTPTYFPCAYICTHVYNACLYTHNVFACTRICFANVSMNSLRVFHIRTTRLYVDMFHMCVCVYLYTVQTII